MATAPCPEPQGSAEPRVSTRDGMHVDPALRAAIDDEDPLAPDGPDGIRRARATTVLPPGPANPPHDGVPFPGDARTSRASIPSFHTPIVPRPRIDALLDEVVRHPVTLVLGGSGTGKTVALAEWARAGTPHGPVCWVSLTGRDATPSRLVRLVREAAAATLGESVIPAGESAEALGDLLEAMAGRGAVLVLDDCDLACNDEAADELEGVLRRPPLGLHLVLLARRRPPLSLHRLRVAGELGEVHVTDLTFTVDEADDLFRSRGFTLPPVEVQRLTEATGGWPAALALSALSLGRARDPLQAASRFTGRDPLVRSYVVAELDGLEPRQRDTLLFTSVVDAVNAPLAAALTADPGVADTLGAMTQANYYVADERGWWHPQPLVLEALRAHLVRTAPLRASELSRRAAAWFEEQGDLERAVDSAVASQDWDLVAGLVLDAVAANVLQVRGLPIPLRLSDVPAPVVLGRAQLQLALAHEAAQHRDHATASARLRWASTLIPAMPDRERAVAVVCHAAIQAGVARCRGDAPALVEASERALFEASRLEAGVLARVGDLGAVRRLLSVGELWSGDAQTALDLLESLTGSAASGGTEAARPDAFWNGLRALALTEMGRLRRARRHAEDAVAEGRRARPGQAAMGWLALARIALLQGDPALAATAVTQGQMSNREEDPFVSIAFRLAEADRRLETDEVARAEAILREVERRLARGTKPALSRLHTALRVEAELARRSVDRAQDLLDRAREQGRLPADLLLVASRTARARRRPGEVEDLVAPLLGRDDSVAGEAWVELALAADASGEEHRSLMAFARALDLAATEGLMRPFLRHDPRVGVLLAHHAAVVGTHPDLVEWLMDARAEDPEPPVPAQVEAVTQRERVVLAYLATMRSNDEIADELGISVNTVKQHLKSIHRKLGVTSRRDAVRMARRLNLVPRGQPGS